MRPPALLLPLLLFALPSPASAAPENLLPNGGFERGLEGWEATGQTNLLKANPDAKTRKEGRVSAHLEKKSGGGIAADYFFAAMTKLPPKGTRITVSAQVKGKAMQNSWLKFYFLDASGEAVNEDVDMRMLRGTFDWREVSAEFTVPEKAVKAELRFYFFLGGEGWIDAAVVAPKGTATATAAAAAAPLDETTRKWLDANAVTIANLDLEGPLDDLRPLKETLKDVRIVQLGEPTHGDGAAFEAKARLVRFLHEEMGFEVLAFESGLYECDRANALLQSGKDGSAAMQSSIFGIWNVSQVRPLFHYLAKRAKTEMPLLLAGFDCRASGEGARGLLDEVGRFLDAPKGDLDPLKTLEGLLDSQGDQYKPPKKDLAAGLAAWERLRKAMDAKVAAGAADVAFLSRVLDNWKVREAFERSKSDASIGEHGSGNIRDGQMGENLRWLAEVRHPGKKIVCWAATFHQARGLTGVKMDGNARFYDGCRNMGQVVHEAFGKACYTIGFAAHGGKAGTFSWQSDLSPPAEGSVEDTLHRYGAPFLFVDLRREGPFGKPLRMSPMSYGRNIEAAWPTVLDGVLFIDVMTPAR